MANTTQDKSVQKTTEEEINTALEAIVINSEALEQSTKAAQAIAKAVES